MAYAHLLFLALFPPPSLAEEVSRRAPGWPLGGRPWLLQSPTRLHVTVQPVAQTSVADALAEPVRRTLDRLASFTAEAFDIRFDQAGALAPQGRGGPIPLGLTGRRGLAGARAFRREVRAALEGVVAPGFAAWKGGEPHMTLCWDRAPAVERFPIEPVGWTVEEVCLVHSHRGESRYDILGRWGLNPLLFGCPPALDAA